MREARTRRIFSTKQRLHGRALACGVALLAALSAPASAAVLLRGYLSGVPSSSLTKQDWTAFQDAAGTLLNKTPSTVGDTQDWEGPSGAHGTLTIKKIFEQHDMPCRDVSTQFMAKNATNGLGYMLTVCRNSQGDWKLVN
ncbi:hypothetical protein [Acidocella sp.]|uniref:hypothetical protein n=1 Tax=Acidocella sp. TaxID=50710 RepID=UPI003D087750